LPAFHFVSLVASVVQHGARCRFHGVDRNLRIDRESLADAISENARLLFEIHFFGFPEELAGIREWCARHGTLLLEDCCHDVGIIHECTDSRLSAKVGPLQRINLVNLLNQPGPVGLTPCIPGWLVADNRGPRVVSLFALLSRPARVVGVISVITAVPKRPNLPTIRYWLLAKH